MYPSSPSSTALAGRETIMTDMAWGLQMGYIINIIPIHLGYTLFERSHS